MESRVLFLVLVAMQIIVTRQWAASEENVKSIKVRKAAQDPEFTHSEPKRWSREPSFRDIRKKPSGHLTPLRPDDMDTEGVVSVAVGPPPVRPKFDRSKSNRKPTNNTVTSKVPTNNALAFVKDVLTQLGREFLNHQVNEDFVFGQYVGNSMKNLTSPLKLKMQHEILDIIVKYQKLNTGDKTVEKDDKNKSKEDDKSYGPRYRKATNDTEEPWPDFSNLAKIVG